MLGKWAKTQQRHHGPFLLLLFLLACESTAAPPGTVELAGLTRMRNGSLPVEDVDVVIVRISGMLPVSIVAHTISDSTGAYRVTYDAVDPGTCGRYFAAARRKLHLGDLQPNLSIRVPCAEGSYTADFLLTTADTTQ